MLARWHLGSRPPLAVADLQYRNWRPSAGIGAVQGNAEAALAAHGGIADAVPGTCREERPAIERWSFGSLTGKMVCYESNTGDAVVLWIYDDSQLFAKALRDDGDMAALLDWWEEIGRFAAP